MLLNSCIQIKELKLNEKNMFTVLLKTKERLANKKTNEDIGIT